MPTIFTHPAPIVALSTALGAVLPFRLMLFGLVCVVLPDLDVIGFRLGVNYADVLGHRGFSHSLFFALCAGLAGTFLAPWLRCSRLAALGVGVLAVCSHIALDALTDGGLGVAVLWPLDQTRYFFEWRPIRVSPFSPRALMSQRGLEVLFSELRWVWLPCLAAGVAARLCLHHQYFRTLKKTHKFL